LLLSHVSVESLENIKDAAKIEGMTDLLKYALIVVSTAPLMILYPFVQKHFVKGMMIGSLKG